MTQPFAGQGVFEGTTAAGSTGPPGPVGPPGPPIPTAANIAALPGVDPGGTFPTSSLAFVTTVRSYWTLYRASAAAADGITIVAAIGGGNWLRLDVPHSSWQQQASWFQDPAAGNDENSGLTSMTALKTQEELIRRLGLTHTGRVRLLPLSGGVDQGPRYVQVATILAYYAPITFGPGTWNFLSDNLTPSGTDIEGSGMYGTIIAQPTGGSVLVQAAIYGDAVGGGTLTLSADVAIGATSITTTASVPAGTILLIQSTGAIPTGSSYVTGTPSGAGPFTLPLDRPTCYAFAAASASVKILTTRWQDCRIAKFRFSGPQGNDYVRAGNSGFNIRVEDCLADDSLGAGSSMAAFLFDTGSVNCGFIRSRVSGGFGFGFYFAQTEGCWMDQCDGTAVTAGGIAFQLEDGINSRIADCRGRGNIGSACIGLNLTSSGNALTGTFGAVIVGCDFGGSFNGIYIESGSHDNVISGTNCDECTNNGIVLDSATAAVHDIVFSGISTKSCVGKGMAVLTGALGIIVDGIDVSGSDPGLSTQGEVWISGITGRNMPANAQTLLVSGGNAYVRNLVGQSPTTGWAAVVVSAGAKASLDAVHLTVDDSAGFSIGIQILGSSTVNVERLTIDGAHAGTRVTGVTVAAAGGVLRLGREMRIDGLAAVVSNGVGADVGIAQTGGTTKVSTTGGTTSLTWAQSQNNEVEVTGVLASDATVAWPSQQSALGMPGLAFDVFNGTTGAHNLLLTSTGGSTVAGPGQTFTARFRINSAGNVVRVSPDT
jgi:hypothetical protein